MSLTIRLILVMAIVAFQTTTAERRLIGENVATVSARLKISLKEWNSWADGKAYETACDLEHKLPLYGQNCFVCVIRKGDKVAGLQFIAVECDGKCYQQFRDRITEAYGFERNSSSDIYMIEGDGSVVRLDLEGDRTARLILTDGDFGKAYATRLLREGLGDFANKLRPH